VSAIVAHTAAALITRTCVSTLSIVGSPIDSGVYWAIESITEQRVVYLSETRKDDTAKLRTAIVLFEERIEAAWRCALNNFSTCRQHIRRLRVQMNVA